eukprot:11184271-Lingulodinium_polyedra.AAC.1
MAHIGSGAGEAPAGLAGGHRGRHRDGWAEQRMVCEVHRVRGSPCDADGPRGTLQLWPGRV